MLAFAHRVPKDIIGCPQPFNACADPVVCNGMGVYLQVHGETVAEACWWCGECSDAERQVLDLACQLASGKPLDNIHGLSVEAFEAARGSTIPDLPATCVRVLLAVEMALVDYQVKTAVATSAGQVIDTSQKLKELGWAGRQGQQRLKAVLEGELARYRLRIPTVKAQEWTAFGTLSDCSRWVQRALKTDLLHEVMERCYPSLG